MKRVIFTLSLLMSLSILSAQQIDHQMTLSNTGLEADLNTAKLESMGIAQSKLFAQRQTAEKSIKSRWYNTAFATKTFYSSQSKVWVSTLFPDSTILLKYTNGSFPVDNHAIAESIDPASGIYDKASLLNISKTTSYTVDSIGIYAIYQRKTATSIVDTLLIQIRKTPKSYIFFNKASSSWVNTDYGVDTLAFFPVYYDSKKNYSTATDVVTIKYPLTANSVNDTLASGWNYFKIAPPSTFNVSAGQSFIINVSFIPGYTWIANTDTINVSKNRFLFVSYEEKGKNTYPNYIKWDWNCSFLQSSSDLYSTAASSKLWMKPSYYFAKGYRYEHHWIEAKLSAEDGTSIQENTASNAIELFQSFPNPTSEKTTIKYYLNTAEKSVSLIVHNLVGKELVKIDKTNVREGYGNFKLDVSNFQAGVYFYTIKVGGASKTRKMIVH